MLLLVALTAAGTLMTYVAVDTHGAWTNLPVQECQRIAFIDPLFNRSEE